MAYTPPQQIILDFIEDFSRKHGLKVEVKPRTKPDLLLKIASLIVGIFNKRFDTGYITTILGTIWVPENFFARFPRFSLETIAHEIVHEYDRKRLGTILFGFLYFCPQIFTIFALLSLFGGMWMLCLLFLICLLPLPSPGRMWIELRGYRTNMIYAKYVYGYSEDNLRQMAEGWIQEKFTGPDYYFMWPFKKYIVRKLMNIEEYEAEQIYKEIFGWLRAKNLTKV